jgi:hypothetical protein
MKTLAKGAFVRRVALSLPGAQETDYKGPRLAVANKAFIHGWAAEARWMFKLPHHQEMMLFDARPETFAPMRAGPMLWSYVRVEDLDAGELRHLIVAAWRMVAPKRLSRGIDTNGNAINSDLR